LRRVGSQSTRSGKYFVIRGSERAPTQGTCGASYAALSLDAATDQQNLLTLRGKDPRPALRTLSEREGPQLCEYGP
jgi:hypothetical protein